MIYVPNDNSSCYVVLNNQTIRSYEKNPNENLGIPINIHDYYINSHYLSKDSVEVVLTNVNCMSNITHSNYYRNDYSEILFIFMLLVIICFYLPTQLILRFFKRFR